MFTIQELRSSTMKELLQELDKARKEMLKVRVNIKTKHEKETAKAKKTKRYIAQVLTVIREAGQKESFDSALFEPEPQSRRQDEKSQKEKAEKSEKETAKK